MNAIVPAVATSTALPKALTTRVSIPGPPSIVIAVRPVGVFELLMVIVSSLAPALRARVVLLENSIDSKLLTVTRPFAGAEPTP